MRRRGKAGEPVQLGRELLGRLHAPLRILFQELVDDAVERGGGGRPDMAQARRLVVDDGVQCGEIRLSGEGPGAGEHFIEHDAEREEVAARAGFAADGLLRCHIRDGADGDAFGGDLRAADRFREPEIGNARNALLGEHDVLRLQVAVNDAVAVGVREAVRDGSHDADGFGDGELLGALGIRLHAGAESAAGEIFEDEKPAAVILIHRVNGGDVGVVQRRDRARFRLETLNARRAGDDFMGQELQCDEPLQTDIESFVHHFPYRPPRVFFSRIS